MFGDRGDDGEDTGCSTCGAPITLGFFQEHYPGCAAHEIELRTTGREVAGRWLWSEQDKKDKKGKNSTGPTRAKDRWVGYEPLLGQGTAVMTRFLKAHGGKWDSEIRLWMIPKRHLLVCAAKLAEVEDLLSDLAEVNNMRDGAVFSDFDNG